MIDFLSSPVLAGLGYFRELDPNKEEEGEDQISHKASLCGPVGNLKL